MSLVVRLLIAVGGVVALVVGIPAMAAGVPGGLMLVVMGGIALLAVVFERARYRSEAAAPGPPFQRTDEAFLSWQFSVSTEVKP